MVAAPYVQESVLNVLKQNLEHDCRVKDCSRCVQTLINFCELSQIVEQHQASSTSNDTVARLMGFATVAQRRKQHARAHMLLANWLAESGQGYHGDILSAWLVAHDAGRLLQ